MAQGTLGGSKIKIGRMLVYLLLLAQGRLLKEIKGVYKHIYTCAHTEIPLPFFHLPSTFFNNIAIILVVKKLLLQYVSYRALESHE